MEPIDNNSEENKSLTPTRNSETDIIKGASNTDQIDAMQVNAAQGKQDQNQAKPANILEVNDGSLPHSDGQTAPSEDLDNPATRGI